jgi:hypothetical protein
MSLCLSLSLYLSLICGKPQKSKKLKKNFTKLFAKCHTINIDDVKKSIETRRLEKRSKKRENTFLANINHNTQLKTNQKNLTQPSQTLPNIT